MIQSDSTRTTPDHPVPAVKNSNTAESKVITYYNDVCDEVDSHFSRALLSRSTVSSCSSNSKEYHASSCSHSPSVSPPPPSVPHPSYPVSLPQQLTTLHDTQPSPKPSSQIYNHHSQFHTSRPAIVYPELANLLVQPKVDSYSDAPKVPGQLTSSSAPSLNNTDYIPCIAINNYGAGSPGNYLDSYVPSKSHYDSQQSVHPTYIPNPKQSFDTLNHPAMEDYQALPYSQVPSDITNPSYLTHSTTAHIPSPHSQQSSSSLFSTFVSSSHSYNMITNPSIIMSSMAPPVELSVDDIHHILAL